MDTSLICIGITFLGYLILLIFIGLYGDKKYGDSFAGFISGQKNLGSWVTAISAAASSESAWVMLGLSGLGYKKGFAAYWAAIGCVLGFLVSGLLMARQLRQEGEHYQSLTLTDYLADKVGGSNTIRIITSLIVVFFMEIYVVAQFAGAGKQMAGMNIMSYSWGVIIGAIIIGIYVFIGGYAAVCITDLVQGLLMALVMLIFPIIGVIIAGPQAIFALSTQTQYSFWAGGEFFTWAAIGFAISQLGIGLGYFGMPHYLVRFITVKNDHEAKKSILLTVSWGFIVLFGSVTLGIAGRVILPELTDPEYILPAFTAHFIHPIIGGIVLAAVTAAIMSTADSQLIMAATAIINDVYIKLSGKKLSDKRKIVLSRLIIAFLTLLALMLALVDIPIIYELVLFAWSALGAAFGPPVLFCLYWKGVTKQGIIGSIISGSLVTVVIKIVPALNGLIYELVPAFIFSFVVGILVSKLGQKTES